MSQATPSSLADLVTRLADNKYMLGRRFSEWTNRAPTLEAAVAAAAMTQDELGHARSLYAALHSLPDSPEAYTREEKPSALQASRFTLDALTQPFGGWAEFVAASVLFDRALTVVFESARESRFEPLRGRAAKILQEESFHRMYGEGWLKRMASAGPKTREAMKAAMNRLWGPTEEWIGSGDEWRVASDEGVLAESGEGLRAQWTAVTRAALERCGLVSNEQ
ncbi:MAG: phenylacetate-CoA oxygenase subunit PaaI [Chloroflexi bacterium]|nr:phenylacetate-CoA oxygenase subunit PaaI [Chloroflexota bacterium]